MKKALIFFGVLFALSFLTAFVSFLVCGGEVIGWALDAGIEAFKEYRAENLTSMIFMLK